MLLAASASRLDLQTPPLAQRARTGNPGAPLRTRTSHPHRARRVASKKNWRPMRPGETFRLQQHNKPQRGNSRGKKRSFLRTPIIISSTSSSSPKAEDGANQHLHHPLRRPAPGRSSHHPATLFNAPPTHVVRSQHRAHIFLISQKLQGLCPTLFTVIVDPCTGARR